MAPGRIRRSARRGIAVAVLGWLGAAVLAVFMAPGAGAAATYTVHIRDLTPPVASVDSGGTVTFINEIADKVVSVGVGPLAVRATVHTDVTLELPSGPKPLPAGASVDERFANPCGCWITYAYRVDGAVLNQVLPQLPVLPARTPFAVTFLPLPNLPSVNLPALPQVNVPLPSLPGTPGGSPAPVPGGPAPGGGGGGGVVDPAQPAQPQGAPGDQYVYQTGAGAPQLSPSAVAAAAAFDPSRYLGSGGGTGSGGTAAGGSGGTAGGYDGASVPVFGQLGGLDGASLDDGSPATSTASDNSPAAQTLPAAALAAVVALAAVTAALVRTHQASRASK